MNQTTSTYDWPPSSLGVIELVHAALEKELLQLVLRPGIGIEATWKPEGMEDTQMGLAGDREDVGAAFSRLSLKEVRPGMNQHALANIAGAFLHLSTQGLVPTFIVCSSLERFREWVGMPDMVALPPVGGVTDDKNFMNVRLRQIEERHVPPDRAVVFGARLTSSSISESRAGAVLLYE
jgi:hypothetical protein